MHFSSNRPFRAIQYACVALAVLSLASGCAGQRLGTQTVRVNYYPDCYQPVTDMRQNAKKLNESVMKGAIGGAVAGAIAGLLTGGGDIRHVVAGAAIGAVAGATVSYLVTSDTQSKQQDERFAIYTQTMDVDYQNLDQAVGAARIAAACYKRAYTQVERDYKAGRMTREEMVSRVTEIRDGSKDAATILRNYNDVAVANIQTYEEIVKAETTRTNDRPPRARVSQVSRKVTTMKTSQNSAETLIAELEDTAAASQIVLDSVRTAEAGILVAELPWAAFDPTDCATCSRS
jgi:uncharacterized membrane protein